MNKKEKRKIIFLFAGILTAMIIFGIVLILIEKRMPEETISDASFLQENPDREEEEKALGSVKIGGKTYDYFHEYETYLVIGTDDTGKHNVDYQGSMSDFLMVVVLDKTENEYSFLPINRDTMTEIRLIQKDGTGQATARLQICTAHWYGGNEEQSCENTVKAVSGLLGGIPIQGYYSIPMKEIPALNKAVNGVELTLLEDFTKIDKEMVKGRTMTLTDAQAYHYVHDRYGVGDEENVSRMKRQRQYMEALFVKAKAEMQKDRSYANKIVQEMNSKVTTNLTGKKISQITKCVIEGKQRGFFELRGKSRLGQALRDGLDHVEFSVYEDSLIQVMKQLYGLKTRK